MQNETEVSYSYSLSIVIDGKTHHIDLDFEKNEFVCTTAQRLTVLQKLPPNNGFNQWLVLGVYYQ